MSAVFFEKYFEGREWSRDCMKIYDQVKHDHFDGRWKSFPETPTQEEVWKWLDRLQQGFDARSVYHTAQSTSDMTGGEFKRQVDIFLKRKKAPSPTDEKDAHGKEPTVVHDWKDLLVVGEHKQSPSKRVDLLLQLARYVREIFISQPTRFFIHAFFLHGTKMELWVFDRSGAYSSSEFDIHQEPQKFVLSLAGYAHMSDEELGLNTSIDLTGPECTVSLHSTAGNEVKTLQLSTKPFVKQRAIVCRGTTCFKTTDDNHVVKFSWTSTKRPPEINHLRQAYETGVEGVAQLVGYHSGTTIAQLRHGLSFPNKPWFRPPEASFFAYSWQEVEGSSVSRTSGKRASGDDQTTASKRRKTNPSTLRQELKGASQPSLASSLYEPTSGHDPFENRRFSCLAISPTGRALESFTTLTELAQALHDAIKAHRSLLERGKILHRDISENNIIITNPEDARGFTGMLIDLDLAKDRGGSRSGARHRTGTMEFMAIGVLEKAPHTFRHDLESFYVLIWMCSQRAWERGFGGCNPREKPQDDILKEWYRGTYEEIARRKRTSMIKDPFSGILKRFPPSCAAIKPLCERLREILFGAASEIDVSSPEDADASSLYDPLIQAFEDAISGGELDLLSTASPVAEAKIPCG